MTLARSLYPALSYQTPRDLLDLPDEERRQALALLGVAYRSVKTKTLQEGLCALAILAASPRLEEHLAPPLEERFTQGADLDQLLEALLVALQKGRDIEGALWSCAHHEREKKARRLRREGAAAQAAPTTTPPKPVLALPQALAGLSPRYQQVAAWLAVGWSPKEIGQALQISEEGAWKLISRVRKALRVRIG